MKRHPALRDLSSDHHQGLVHARRLVKAVEGNATGEFERVSRDFIAFWAEHTTRHFREEEEVLLPAFARYGDPSGEPFVRILVEHVHIRRLVGDLRGQIEEGNPSPATMQQMGDLLREHIRHEENVVFPLIEQAMPEEALHALSQQLASFNSPTAAPTSPSSR